MNIYTIPQAEVVSVMRAEYASWVKQLSSEERYAIRKYSFNSLDVLPGRFYMRLNSALRGDYLGKDKEKLLAYADTISGAVRKKPLEHPIMCYRRTATDDLVGASVGDVIMSRQFLSTSVIESRALKHRIRYAIYAPAGIRGAYIEKLSVFPWQREFLIDRETSFKVLSIREDGYILEVLQ